MDTLDLLLGEFFAPATLPDRKKTIEAQLDSQRLSLDECRYMLTNARSDYLAWFAASQFQKRIQEEWAALDPALQHANRSFLLQFLQQHFGPRTGLGLSSGLGGSIGMKLPSGGGAAGGGGGSEITNSGTGTAPAHSFSPFVLNKVVQLVTDIAIQDWPDRFQDLFSEIHKLIQSKNNNHALLGWTLLEAVVQEFEGTCPARSSHRSHLTLSQHKRYLWEHFKEQVPDLLTLIVQHLDACYNKTLVAPLSTEAPAPSPVEHSIWGTSSYGRRPSAAASHLPSPLVQMNGSFQNSLSGSRAVPGSMNNSFMSPATGDQSTSYSYGKSPTTILRKSLNQFLGDPTSNSSPHLHNNDLNNQWNSAQSPVGSGLFLNHARQRMGSISELGQMAMRRSSINAAARMESRRGSVETTFVSGSRMDSHTRKTCLMALKSLTTLLSCPGLDPRQLSFSASITMVLKFSTLHQNKTVDLGILALSCLNGLVARPGFLAVNQEALTMAVRTIADLIRYFNEVKDGIDDIDESYLQMFMHFVSLFCTLSHLERAETVLGLSVSDFLLSFARFTLEKVSVDYLKSCMDVWKSLLDAVITAASDIPRPIPAQHPLRRMQAPTLYFMSALVEKFYKMKGATRSEDAFSTFEVEDEEDLEELTELVESFVGLVGEVFTEEVIEMLDPLLKSQLGLYAEREIDECKTLPVTLGILSRVAYNFLQNFEPRREYTSNLMIYLTRMTKLSIEHYVVAIGGAKRPGKDEVELTGSITLALFGCLLPLIPWLDLLWKAEVRPLAEGGSPPRALIAKEIYQELAQISEHLFQSLLPTSPSTNPVQSSPIPNSTFLGPGSMSFSSMDRKLLLTSANTLSTLTRQVKVPVGAMTPGVPLFWQLNSTLEMATCLSQNALSTSSFMGADFPASKGSDTDIDESRQGMTPNDELFCVAFVALSNGVMQEQKSGQEQQIFDSLVAQIIYPLQSALQDSRSGQSNGLAAGEAKLRVHRSLTILRALINSVDEASVLARTIVFEGLKPALPLVQEFFEVYFEDHVLSMDILRYFKATIKCLYRQLGTHHCMEITRVLMDRLTSPALLDAAFPSSANGTPQHLPTLHQGSLAKHQRQVVERIQMSLSILDTVMGLPGKEISRFLAEFMQFLFSQLGPRLYGIQGQGAVAVDTLGTQAQLGQRAQENGQENGVIDLMTVFLSTIKVLLSQHSRYFFKAQQVQNGLVQTSIEDDNLRNQALQSCMEYLARGLYRPEPDLVRHSVEILVSLQEHNLCRLFDRLEFQSTYRNEFLKIVFGLALNHEQDLLLEDLAGLVHKMVNSHREGGDASTEKFLEVWHGDLKRYVAVMEPSQVAVVSTSTLSAGSLLNGNNGPHSPAAAAGLSNGRSPRSLTEVQFSDAMKETLWMDLARIGDASEYRDGLYDFVNDARVYAQSLVR
ncbi:Exportin-6 [Linnemannia exigua]|uniref:Exportin-6 n=1 Tax=Linnemannia exigua TaxID=604196 RepID=A0AAD4H643_9FUNG|nr:Exportin-6 [Linnemannia exigua]